MKKVLTIITIMVILLSISIISNAAVELTEDNLSILLDEVCGYEKTIELEKETENGTLTNSVTVDYQGYKYQVDTNQDTITLNMADYGNIIINYDLENTNTPKFNYNLVYTKQMTFEEFGQEITKGSKAQEFIISIVGKSKGVLPEDMSSFISNEYIDKELFLKAISMEASYKDGITSAKEWYDEKLNISNEYVEFSYKDENETSEKYTVKANLEIKENADFSKLEGFAQKTLEEGKFDDWFDISLGESNDTSTNELSNSLGNTDNNKESNVIANIQKIPQTGNGISLQKILYSVIVIATLLGVCLAIYNRKH